MAKKEINIFSISLLDLLSGALGAVIILYVIIPKMSAAEAKELAELQQAKEVVADIQDILNRIMDGEELGHVDQALYDQLQEKFIELEETVSSLEGQLNNAMNEIAALQVQVAALEKALSECEQNGDLLAEALATAQATNEELAEQLEEEADINNQLTAEIEALQQAMAEAEIEALTKELDLVIAMDFTGSMDEEIEDLKANANGLVKILERTVASLRVGFVVYRDYYDDYPGKELESIGLTTTNTAGMNALHAFLDPKTTYSGNDIPEKVDLGLGAAVKMDWRPEAKKVIVVIGDAPAHAGDIQTCYDMAARFAAQPRSEVAAINADGDADAVAFFEELARKGNGDYVDSHGRMLESILLSVIDK